MKQEYSFEKAKRGRFFRPNAKLRYPASVEESDWAGPSNQLGNFIVREARRSLSAYREQPKLITEHARSEQDTAQGGYAHRQLFELVQNSADALLESPKGQSILIRLTNDMLYCADNGLPIDERGVEGLMFDRMSSKRKSPAIGRFGRGFKSVLGVSDAPEFYSRSGSFRFDRRRTAERIAKVSPSQRYPVLRLPEPIDPHKARETDEELRELMSWATNIVRLPLKAGAQGDLARQILSFPPEFMLFVDHVRYLTLEDGKNCREFLLHREENELRLDSGDGRSRWRRFDINHRVSDEARADWLLHDDRENVTVSWAAPLDRLDRPGQFWAFFPTNTVSLVAGILNAPWKTNEDRQNLLPGVYNDELIEAAAKMIANAISHLATHDDPARHLDALPREHRPGDSEQANLLRGHLFADLEESNIVPDQDGNLRLLEEISYPPSELTKGRPIDLRPFERWAKYTKKPRAWLHHKAITPIRLARIDRLYCPDGELPRWARTVMPRASVADWLEALVEGKEANEAVQASRIALQTAALVPRDTRSITPLGDILLTASGNFRKVDPEHVFLPDGQLNGSGKTQGDSFIHPELVSDLDTLSSLKTLGFRPPSPESRFKLIARRILRSDSNQVVGDNLHRQLWVSSRELSAEVAATVIRKHKGWEGRENWPRKLRVRTRAGTWQPLFSVLLPGAIVPDDDSCDENATVDTDFHELDEELLRDLGATDVPQCGRNLSLEDDYTSFRILCRRRYSSQDNLPHSPNKSYLDFISSKGVGPLAVLQFLSDEGGSRYTDAVLNLDDTYLPWTMWHTGTNRQSYPKKKFRSATTYALLKHGRVQTSHGAVPLAHALGSSPKSTEAVHALLTHPKADQIKRTFDLQDPSPEFFGLRDPIPLTDIWPGLNRYLPRHRRQCRLISCERILVGEQRKECVLQANDVYLVGGVDDEEQHKLALIANTLNLGLNFEQIKSIVLRRTPYEIKERRAVIRECSSDAERLLAAIGEQELRLGLPSSLLAVLELDGNTLPGTEIAEAAIATYHTGALKHYGWALGRLDPPSQWAGSLRAVQFVRSLGFSAEWAGERNRKRDPFLEVEGPHSLPELHDYQRIVVGNVRNLLRREHGEGSVRRGMISLPTGSGKTRVAVQAIVEAMCDDGFRGGILWIADRDELCEQAVESWKQVWASIGAEAVRLRISRLWSGQPPPIPRNDLHVVVATIQTLNSRLENRAEEYKFLADFKLVVFDEAHRSIARTFTSVMGEIGLTRFQKSVEPFMLGLTATPYRGHDEEETARLVRRYGNKRLDSGAFASDIPEEVIQELQGTGVLAQADHETIEGESIELDALIDSGLDEDKLHSVLEEWLKLPWLPASVEERIAQSAERTKRIIDAYKDHVDPEWPTLVFATSVEHAQTVAALLNRSGIESRSVNGETKTATRRRIVEEFRRGEIKALVNYGVFREGFDAPKTRAIIVARPVYSPNLYFQMIGRGLRGPLNGGDERCLILNVRDNITNFNRALAFSELDWLWA